MKYHDYNVTLMIPIRVYEGDPWYSEDGALTNEGAIEVATDVFESVSMREREGWMTEQYITHSDEED